MGVLNILSKNKQTIQATQHCYKHILDRVFPFNKVLVQLPFSLSRVSSSIRPC